MAQHTRPPTSTFEDALAPVGRTARRWLLAGLILALALLVAVAGWLIWRQYEDAKREAAEDLRARAVLAATVLDTYFTGQLAALSAIASSPAVVTADAEAMSRYFARFRPGADATFPAGVGWIDLQGRQRATSDPRGPTNLNLAGRSYFQQAVKTKKPFVAEAIVARTTQRRLIVLSVPTRDARGRLSGVLAGGIVLQRSSEDSRASELGYEGVEFLDREGQQLSRRDLARPANMTLAASLAGKEGVRVDTRGLAGSAGRVVAYASSKVPSWTVVLDQPTSVVFADARRSLILESALLAGATIVMLLLVIWTLARVRRDTRSGRAHIRRWADFTRSLNDARDLGTVADVLAATLASEFPHTTCLVSLVGASPDASPHLEIERGERSRIAAMDHTEALELAGSVIGEGRFVALDPPAGLGSRQRRGAVRRARSLYGAPLFEGGEEVAGVAVLVSSVERALSADDQRLMRAYVDQTSQGIARVRLQQQEHDVAVVLQESLLPRELPTDEGVVVSAYYRAGVENTNVGGDWYDAVRRPDGIVHLTVGDVAGRGIDAAVSMGELRHAFRAYALEQRSPGAIVERMGRHVGDEGMATMVCVSFDPLTGELAHSSAGHLPPLLIDPEARTVVRLDGAGSPPLGWRQPTSREDGRTTLSRATLALYTDGLVERRSLKLDDGIAALEEALLDVVSTPSESAGNVVGLMMDETHEDDLALMLAELEAAPSRIAVEVDADSSLLRELRRRVRAWLEARGMSESDREATVLALSEACNNAIEHAYRDRPGHIGIELRHEGFSISLRVSDSGDWREPVPDETRGRGLVLMQGLMHAAEVKRSSRGTDVLLERSLRS